ncbi:DUF378 domain-containing protein [Candidatus Peregrinibacteria bacterium CG10_big_fil_rev_8_21_14_0_10_49_16]|nr:MAG: DUF378 domain-containing protein [Candidatus Peregrinibacteria bacterium CG22_combo_CG10-13_8_21_14_all_49_11]PIR51930.1 MAG: DUF378 domain-containing protein [Candidatus Peregrinibacteria bacterium CG10_big_fil_rev_8_21_14_0_10_49_16]
MCGKGSCGKVAGILVLVGALNWGLVGLGGFMGQNWNVVNMVLGAWPQVEWIVYVLVGLSAVYMLVNCSKCCKI